LPELKLNWLKTLQFVKNESGFSLTELNEMNLESFFLLQNDCIAKAKKRIK